jgi:ATP-dependent RNA helicase RhlE
MSPKIRALAEEILRNPETITVDRQKPASGIEHCVYLVEQDRKAALLSKLLRREGMQSVLVFVRRKADADRLARAVRRGGVEATSIHADRTQEQRIEALEDFRTGRVPVLVATDVASRGLDVDGISHVINFDVPHSPEDYIHRSGRTARAGAVGDVFTFVSPEERYGLADIEKVMGSAIPRRSEPGFDDDRAPRSAPRPRTSSRADNPRPRPRSRPRHEAAAPPPSADGGEKPGRGPRRRGRRGSRPAVVSAP